MTYLAANSPYLQNAVSSPPTSAIRTLSNTPGGGRGWTCFCFTTIGDDIGGSEGIEVEEDVEGGEDIFDRNLDPECSSVSVKYSSGRSKCRE